MDIHIKKRHLYILGSLIMLCTSILFVQGTHLGVGINHGMGQGQNQDQKSSNFGHSGDDIIVTIGNEQKTLNEALSNPGSGSGSLSCKSVRVSEGQAKIGSNPGSGVIDIPKEIDAPESNIGNNKWFGADCLPSYELTGCTHAAASDNDFLFVNNGCYADKNDGGDSQNFVDIMCCKIN